MDTQPNGEAEAGPSTTPFSSLSLAVDAYTLDSASGKRRLRALQPDGTVEYDDP